MNKAVWLHTFGFEGRADSTVSMNAAPSTALDGAPGGSDCAGVGRIQLTSGSVSAATCCGSCSIDHAVMPLSYSGLPGCDWRKLSKARPPCSRPFQLLLGS